MNSRERRKITSGETVRVRRWLALVAVLFFGCGDASEQGETEQVDQKATSPTAINFAIDLPGGLTPHGVALAATSSLSLGTGVTLREKVDRFSARVVNTGHGATILGAQSSTGDVWSQGDVTLRTRSRVDGDVHTAGAFRREHRAAVTGVVTEHKPIAPFKRSSWAVDLPMPSTGITVERNETKALEPGGYQRVLVRHGKLLLRAGLYAFDELSVDARGIVAIDDSSGPVSVYVRRDTQFRGAVVDAVDTSSDQVDLLLVALADRSFFVAAPFSGTFYVPNGALTVGAYAHHATFIGKRIEVHPRATIHHRRFPWETILPTEEFKLTPAPVILSASRRHDTAESEVGQVNPAEPVAFEIPAYLPVRAGNAGNGTAALLYTSASHRRSHNARHGGRARDVTCRYKGGATTSHPTAEIDVARGLRYNFVSCSNGLRPGDKDRGTNFRLRIEGGDGQHFPPRTSTELHLGGGCSGPLAPPLAPHEVVELRNRVSTWLITPQVAETDPDGHPALRYALIYLETKEQLAGLDRMRLLWSAQPLVRSHMQPYFGKCGHMEHASDGKGVFVFAVLPAKLYNYIRQAGIYSALHGLTPPVRAIVPAPADEPGAFNEDGSLDYATLVESGFAAWLVRQSPSQQFDAFTDGWNWLNDNVIDPATGGATEISGSILGLAAGGWDGFWDFMGAAADQAWEEATIAFQNFALIFEDSITVKLNVTVPNLDPAFTSGPMRRSWGKNADDPIVPAGVMLFAKQWWGPLPVMDRGELKGDGRVSIEAIEGAPKRDGGICIELENEWGLMTSDLAPNEVCNFALDLNIFERNGTHNLLASDHHVHAFTQITDNAAYSRQVVDHEPHQAEVLTGFLANQITNLLNGGEILDLPGNDLRTAERAMTLCLDFPGMGAGLLTELLATIRIFGVQVGAASPLLLKDIWWPDERNARPNLHSRGVMTHEYGHFMTCSLLFETPAGPQTMSGLIERVTAGEDRDDTISVLLEALADTWTLHVVGGTNYFSGHQALEPMNNRMSYCIPRSAASRCLEFNFKGSEEIDDPFDDEIARYVSLFHDALDSQFGSRGADDAWNGDVWMPGNPNWGNPFEPPLLVLSPTAYITIADENVELGAFDTLRGSTWKDWFDKWLDRGRGVTRQNVLGGLNDVMEDRNHTWCDRCEVFALHEPETPTIEPNDVPMTYADHLSRWRVCASKLADIVGSPPTPVGVSARLAVNQNCEPCDALEFSDNGVCTPCPPGTISAGDHCDACPSGSVPREDNTCEECAPNQISDGDDCDDCPAGSGGDRTTNTCEPCPIDATVDWLLVPRECVERVVVRNPKLASDICPFDFWVEVLNADDILTRENESLGLSARILPIDTTAEDCPKHGVSIGAFQPNGDFPGLTLALGGALATFCLPLQCPDGHQVGCDAPSASVRVDRPMLSTGHSRFLFNTRLSRTDAEFTLLPAEGIVLESAPLFGTGCNGGS
jgi:hypothetical protein